MILFRRYYSLLLVLAALALFSCAPPLMESARIHKGLSLGGGLGVCNIEDNDFYQSHGQVKATNFGGALFTRYGFGERFSVGLQGSIPTNPVLMNIYLSAKWKLGKTNACGLSAGLRAIRGGSWDGWYKPVNFYILQDAGEILTFKFGATYVIFNYGAAGSIDAGLDVHPKISNHLRAHISLGLAFCGGVAGGGGSGGGASLESQTAAIGIEYLVRPR